MPDWLHRTTKRGLRSIAAADLPEPQANYIEDPDLSNVQGVPKKYWKIEGDTVSEMNASEKQAVDEVEANYRMRNARDSGINSVDDIDGGIGHNTRALVELLNKRDNYIVNRLEEVQATLSAIKATTGAADNIRAAIPDDPPSGAEATPASFSQLVNRTRKQAIDEYKRVINDGEVDDPGAEGAGKGKGKGK